MEKWNKNKQSLLQIDPKEVVLSENGKPAKVKITTTVPIVCQDGTEQCNVQLEVAQTKQDTFVDYCTLKLVVLSYCLFELYAVGWYSHRILNQLT